tara:strand:- start:9715 stop:10596 length:882 start_codon:yes stop_codon:yes gene_type:complete
MSTTLSTLRTETYSILNDLQTSNVYSTSFIDQTLNDQQAQVCALKKWSFLRSKKLFVAADDTTLTTTITTASTQIVVGSITNFETSGALWIDHDVIDYTDASTTTITGVTNIGVGHDSGVKVYPLVLIPTDYERMPVLLKKSSGSSRFGEVLYVDEMSWDDFRVGNGQIQNKFTVVNDESSDSLYIRMENVAVGDDMVFYYLKKPTVMTDDSDTATIPDPYALKILPKLAAYKAMILRNDNLEGLGTIIEKEAKEELLAMQKYYGSREESWSKLIQPTYRSGMGGGNRTRIRI